MTRSDPLLGAVRPDRDRYVIHNLNHVEAVLGGILRDHSRAEKTIQQYFHDHPKLGSSDRAIIGDVTLAVVRWRRRLDHALSQSLTRFIGDGVPEDHRTKYLPLAVLLLSGYSVSTGTAAFAKAGIDSELSPEACEHVATSTRDLDPWTSSSPTDLAVRASLPDWIVDALVKDHGWDRAVSLAVASQTRAPITLRANTLRATRESLLASLSAEGIPSIASEFSPWGVRLPGRHEVKNLVVFRSGLCDVQDEGSQLVALLTGVTPGMVVIDTCAGAGGKTLALSNMMENRGELVAFDSDKKKLDILRTRMRQAGAQIADAVLVPRSPEAFASDPRLTVWYERADVVLIDAPCSGSGTWRRNPDGPEHSTRESVLRSADLQRRLLTAYSRLLRPGGRLIYATCSLFREENQNVVEAWIAETPDFASIDAEIVFPQSLGPRICSDGYLQVAPDIHGTDGFFAAVMEKRK